MRAGDDPRHEPARRCHADHGALPSRGRPGESAARPPSEEAQRPPLLVRSWRDLAAAVRFLTLLPIPAGRTSEASPSSPTPWFPLVGLLVGGLLVTLAVLLPDRGLLPAAVILAAWTAVTGGLHEDGWADCADAALPAVSRQRRLQILKDPRVGAHGLLAVVVLMLLRVAGIADAPAWALAAPPVLGRWGMVLSLAGARALRPEGLGVSLARSARPVAASVTAAAALALVVAVATRSGATHAWTGAAPALALAAVVAAAAGGGLGAFLQRRLGGLSGDGHGAVGIAAETAALCSLALWSGAVPA